MTRILLVHHNAELYGADRSLLRLARTLRQGGFDPVVVVPETGLLVPLLQAEGHEVHVGPVGKLARRNLGPLGLPRLALELVRSVRFMDRVVGGRPIALVHTNSIAALGGALWGRLRGVRRLWHVREIVTAPPLATIGLPWLLERLGGDCVCVSDAVRDWITATRPALLERSRTIWNGVEPLAAPPPREAVAALRARLGLEAQHVLVTLAGRINRGKGQDMFVEAARRLRAQDHHELRYLIVGDVVAGQDALREAMLRQIQHAGLDGVVLWHPFTPEIDVVWAASDIAAVPSTGPESFGRVAIEAMAHGLPVVAAAQGGLAEIVVPDRTGLLVPPGDSAALADAIGRLAGDVPLRQRLGEAGRQRQRERFSQEDHDRRLLAVVERLVGVGGGAAGPSGRAPDTAG